MKKLAIMFIIVFAMLFLSVGCGSSGGSVDELSDKNITFGVDDEAKVKSTLCGKTWYVILYEGAESVVDFKFNDDCTILNEGTEVEENIEIVGNRLNWLDNDASNYTIFTTDTGVYVLAYNVYGDGRADAPMWLYRDRGDAQDSIAK